MGNMTNMLSLHLFTIYDLDTVSYCWILRENLFREIISPRKAPMQGSRNVFFRVGEGESDEQLSLPGGPRYINSNFTMWI